MRTSQKMLLFSIAILLVCVTTNLYMAISIPGTLQNPPGLPQWLQTELPTIWAAAERNGLRNEDWPLLLAIRRAERGGPGREFGIMDSRAYNLDLQAAWASCTIIKHHKRHDAHDCGLDFVECLGLRYCPPEAHPGNVHWLGNVRYFISK